MLSVFVRVMSMISFFFVLVVRLILAFVLLPNAHIFFILKHEIEAKFGGSFLDKVDRIFIYYFIEDHARKEEIILRTRLQFLIQRNSIREIPL